MEEKNMETIMGLIIYSGDAKSKAIEAIKSAKMFDFKSAESYLKEANESLILAHNSQTEQLAKEASGQGETVSLLMVHGQDHLMNAITFIDLAREIIDVYHKMNLLMGGQLNEDKQ